MKTAYDEYVRTEIEAEAGTVSISPSGYLYYFYPDFSEIYGGTDYVSVSSSTESTVTFLTSASTSSSRLYFCYDFAPFVKGNSLLGNVTVVSAPSVKEASDPSNVFSIDPNGELGFLSRVGNTTYSNKHIYWASSSSSSLRNLDFGKTVTSGLGPWFYRTTSSLWQNTFTLGYSCYGTSYVTLAFEPLVVAYDPIDITGTVITEVGNRVGNISGDFGIIGDNNTIIKSDQNYIVNETNNTVYNPATGQTSEVTDWTYDYSTRTYNLTLSTGDTVTVTYGDEYVSYVEGDTTYNIYYITNNNGGGSGEETPCTHNWEVVAGGRLEPTCTVAGYQEYKCSICSETKRDALPAAGHSWTVKQAVTTEYDEIGNLVTEGYTLYECSVCGEQYKDTSGTGPPSGGGSGEGGSGDGVFSGIFGILYDFFSFMFGFFSDFVAGGIKGFISALLDGASEFFGILNPAGWFT